MGGLDVDRALYLLRVNLKDFMTRGSTRVERNFFIDLSQRMPALSWKLLLDYCSYLKTARTFYLKHYVFLIFSDLLKRPEAVGEHAENLQQAIGPIREAFIYMMKQQHNLKPDWLVIVLQCLKLVISTLQQRASMDNDQIKKQLFEVKEKDGKEEDKRTLLDYMNAMIQKRSASVSVCGNSSQIYTSIGLEAPPELQKNPLTKKQRKIQRREARQKKQEEREKKRQERIIQTREKQQEKPGQEKDKQQQTNTTTGSDASAQHKASATATQTQESNGVQGKANEKAKKQQQQKNQSNDKKTAPQKSPQKQQEQEQEQTKKKKTTTTTTKQQRSPAKQDNKQQHTTKKKTTPNNNNNSNNNKNNRKQQS